MKFANRFYSAILLDSQKSIFTLFVLVFILALSILAYDVNDRASSDLKQANKILSENVSQLDSLTKILAESRLLKASLDLRANMAAVSELDRYLSDNNLSAEVFVFDEAKNYFAKNSNNHLDRFQFSLEEASETYRWNWNQNANASEFVDRVIEVNSGEKRLGYLRFLVKAEGLREKIQEELLDVNLKFNPDAAIAKSTFCSSTVVQNLNLCIHLGVKEVLNKSGALILILIAFGLAILLLFWLVVRSKTVQERAKTLAELSSQVSHDIQSPLLALKVAARNLRSLPEEQRLLISRSISRIEDIVNDLNRKKELDIGDGQVKHHLLSGLVSSIVSEKRLQFKFKPIEIDLYIDDNVRESFVLLTQKEFKRVLSNLVNNSVEAIADKGNVGVELEDAGEYYRVKIIDNGKGIAKEELSLITQKGYSIGKTSGQGLGLYHASAYLQSINASMKIESQESKGTSIEILIPKANKPAWYPDNLNIPSDAQIIVVDDDASIHELWKEKFSLELPKQEVKYFYNFESLEKYLLNEPGKKRFYFLDFEVLNAKYSGLEFIQTYELQENAFLVTGRYDDELVLNQCVSSSIKLLPKPLLEYVQLSPSLESKDFDKVIELFGEPKEKQWQNVFLIDDDPLVHQIWQSRAQAKGISLQGFRSPQEFLSQAEKLSKEASVFIDYELGDQRKGDEWAKDLFELGFKDLCLTTGYNSKSLKPRYWITKVISKDPPF